MFLCERKIKYFGGGLTDASAKLCALIAGSHPLSGHKMAQAWQPARGRPAESDRDRRLLSQQLLSFSKVLTELAGAAIKKTPDSSSPNAPAAILSARDSTLMQVCGCQ